MFLSHIDVPLPLSLPRSRKLINIFSGEDFKNVQRMIC